MQSKAQQLSIEISTAEKAIRNAVATLRSLLGRAREDTNIEVYVQIDTRALDMIQARLDSDLRKADIRELVLWVGQIAMHWEIRYRGASKILRPILDLRAQYAG